MAVWDLFRWRPRYPMAQQLQDLLTVHRHHLPLIDLLLNFFLLTPIIVLHYHATCQVLDYILVSTFPRFGPCLLFVAGISITFTFAYYQRKIPGYISEYLPHEGENSEIFRAIASRLYTFSLTFVTLSHMKAVTDLFLQSSGGSLDGALRAAITSIIVLWGMRGSRNILAAPVCLGMDKSDEDYHVFSTAFNTEPTETVENAADVLATVGVAYTMNHLHWAGMTSLMDNLFFPHHFWLSLATSLFLGYAVCFAVIIFQQHAKEISRDLEREALWKKLVFEDAYIFLSGFGVINTWRGIWMFYDALTDTFPVFIIGTDITCFVGFLVSFLTLLVGQLCNSLPYKGFDKDGELKDGEGCLCPTSYLIDLIQQLEDTRPTEDKDAPDENHDIKTTHNDVKTDHTHLTDDVNQNSVVMRQTSVSSYGSAQYCSDTKRRSSAEYTGSTQAQPRRRRSSSTGREVTLQTLTQHSKSAKANGSLKRHISSKFHKSK